MLWMPRRTCGRGHAGATACRAGFGAIADAMRAYRAGRRPATVMDRIAKGFSDDEIKAIAAWFAAQR